MTKTLLILLTFVLGLTGSVVLLAGHDEREEHDSHEYHENDHEDEDDDRRGWLRRFAGSSDTAQYPVRAEEPAFASYSNECGACHMAYPPGMLAKESWRAMMANLENHFGDNAELDAGTAAEIGEFLERHGNSKIAAASTKAPARITETGWFRAQHHEIPARMVKNNPGVQSFSRCEACHTRATEASFNEHDVRIPGYGYWDD
ncbi:MAG: diheme cytochrome c [Sedimenticolaceae bacterium]|nr:diheme cytochrome c [Sedimenticolaceae bacterium]